MVSYAKNIHSTKCESIHKIYLYRSPINQTEIIQYLVILDITDLLFITSYAIE